MNVRALFHGAPYFITSTDDFPHFSHVYLVSHKSKALDFFTVYLYLVGNQLDKMIKTFMTDCQTNSSIYVMEKE